MSSNGERPSTFDRIRQTTVDVPASDHELLAFITSLLTTPVHRERTR